MPIAARTRDVSDYSPIPSVWDGRDAELLERILDFHPRRTPRLILDATVNGGRFWRGQRPTGPGDGH